VVYRAALVIPGGLRQVAVRGSVGRPAQLGQLHLVCVLLAAVITSTHGLQRRRVVVLAVAKYTLLRLPIGIQMRRRQLITPSILLLFLGLLALHLLVRGCAPAAP
jgi:hypothetical protein